MSWIAVGVVGVSVVTSLAAGQQAKKAAKKEAELTREGAASRQEAANFEANVLEVQATQKIAAAQRDMLDVQRVTKLAESRAQALAAASGGGATSPTALNVIAGLAKEGAYNGARALYSGEEAARTMRLQAQELRKSGEFSLQYGDLAAGAAESRGKAAELGSYASALSSIGGLYAKYGGNGPGSSGQQTGYFQFTGYDRAGGNAYG